jgi:hypothetical protein
MFRLSVSAIAFYQTEAFEINGAAQQVLAPDPRRLPLINVCWCFPRCVLLAVGRKSGVRWLFVK